MGRLDQIRSIVPELDKKCSTTFLISCWVSGSKAPPPNNTLVLGDWIPSLFRLLYSVKSVLGDAKRVEASVVMHSEISLTKELANFSGDALQDFVDKGVASSVRQKLK